MTDPIFLRLYVFTFLVPLRFPRETMFGLSLPPIVCRRAHVLYTLSVFIFSYWSGVFGGGLLCCKCCQFLLIVHFVLLLRCSLAFVFMNIIWFHSILDVHYLFFTQKNMFYDICYLVMGPLDPILNSDQMKYLNHSQHAIVEEQAFYHFHNFHM